MEQAFRACAGALRAGRCVVPTLSLSCVGYGKVFLMKGKTSTGCRRWRNACCRSPSDTANGAFLVEAYSPARLYSICVRRVLPGPRRILNSACSGMIPSTTGAWGLRWVSRCGLGSLSALAWGALVFGVSRPGAAVQRRGAAVGQSALPPLQLHCGVRVCGVTSRLARGGRSPEPGTGRTRGLGWPRSWGCCTHVALGECNRGSLALYRPGTCPGGNSLPASRHHCLPRP